MKQAKITLTIHTTILKTWSKNYNYFIKYKPDGRFTVYNKTSDGALKYLFRLDRPHKDFNFNHINGNPKTFGGVDPHLKIPAGFFHVNIKWSVKKFSKNLQILNFSQVAAPLAKLYGYVKTVNDNVIFPIVVANDIRLLAMAGLKDKGEGTTVHTKKALTKISGQYGGGFVGGKTGAVVGNMIYPVFGGMIGGVAGSIIGVVYGPDFIEKLSKIIKWIFAPNSKQWIISLIQILSTILPHSCFVVNLLIVFKMKIFVKKL